MAPPGKKRKKTILTFSRVAIQPGDIVVVLDLNGRVVNWNEEVERVLGFTAEEVKGQPWSVLFPDSGLEVKSILAGREFAGVLRPGVKTPRQSGFTFLRPSSTMRRGR